MSFDPRQLGPFILGLQPNRHVLKRAGYVGIPLVAGAPVNTVAPVISGTATEGFTLTTTNGTWTESPTFAYQWKRGGVAIGGATATTYLLVAADAGFSITCTVTATATGGSSSATSNIIGPINGTDSTPDAFFFTDTTSVVVSSTQTSNTITVAGINTSAAVSVTGGTYSKNGGAYTSAAGTALVGDTFSVRHTASAANSTAVDTTLTIGGVSDTFTSTTAAAGVDTTPDPFFFTDATIVTASSTQTSNTITVAGINASTAVSIVGGTYSKNGGAYTSAAGTALAGDTFSVQHTASASASTAVDTTLTIGGVSDTFTSTTAAAGGYSSYALADAFTLPEYWLSGTQYTPVTTLPGYSFARSGEQGAVNASGAVQFFAANVPAINSAGYHAYGALTNLLLNAGSSSALATQTTAALTAVAHTISFIGTGSVALSGAFTGSLAGTGATNQVSLNFTPTAAALTVTVTGDVRFAGLMAGTLSGAIPVITTTTAAVGIGASVMSHTQPITTDQDFIVWAVADLPPVTTASDTVLLQLGSSLANRITLYRSATTGSLGVNSVGGTGGVRNSGVMLTGEGRVVVMHRRRGGKDTTAVKVGGAVTIAAESVATTWAAPNATLEVGFISGAGATQINGTIEGGFIRTGTFTDAEMTTILESA